MHTILLIGSGRLAQHLIFWNSLIKAPNTILNWSRKNNSVDELDGLVQQADIIWLAILDSALLPFTEQHLSKFTKPVVHFSGAFDNSRLVSAHPLMSFPSALMDSDVYPNIHFVLTGRDSLQSILPGFSNSHSSIPDSQKPFYHALCVLTGNFPQLLWSKTFSEFANLNIPDQAVEVYVQQITANYIQLKNAALTGPLVRKDRATIEKNIQSLEKSKLKKIYEIFVEVFTS